MTESDQGVAYGATFGTSHSGAGLSALEAEYMALRWVITIVPSDLTLYVVYTSQCQIDLQIHMNTWFKCGEMGSQSWGQTPSMTCGNA